MTKVLTVSVESECLALPEPEGLATSAVWDARRSEKTWPFGKFWLSGRLGGLGNLGTHDNRLRVHDSKSRIFGERIV